MSPTLICGVPEITEATKEGKIKGRGTTVRDGAALLDLNMPSSMPFVSGYLRESWLICECVCE